MNQFLAVDNGSENETNLNQYLLSSESNVEDNSRKLFFFTDTDATDSLITENVFSNGKLTLLFLKFSTD